MEFAAAGQNLPQQSREKIKKFPEMAPVFNLKEMLEAEAEKLRIKVEEASLMAAKAVEEAEQKVQQIAHEAASDIPEKEIEDMVKQNHPTQCSKIRKKVPKTHFLQFQKWQKNQFLHQEKV